MLEFAAKPFYFILKLALFITVPLIAHEAHISISSGGCTSRARQKSIQG